MLNNCAILKLPYFDKPRGSPMFQYTGEYKQHHSSNLKETNFYTFTPMPLSDGVPLPVDDELFALLTMAHRQMGILEGMLGILPDNEIFKELLCLTEACYSLWIDNVDDRTLNDVLKSRLSTREDLRGVHNTLFAQQASCNKTITGSELAIISRMITEGPGATKPAPLRKNHKFIRRVIANRIIHMLTPPEDILPALDDLTKFIRMDNHTDILIKAALAHYQFEMIHPFEKNNGIVGRVLILMMLSNAEYHAAPYLCLSEFLYNNREDYFDKLSATQRGSGFVPWIKFFVQAIYHASFQTINRVERFAQTASEDEKTVTLLAKSSKCVWPVYNFFKRYLVSEIKPVAEFTGISYNTVAKVARLLTEADILNLEREQTRHKVFIYSKLHEIINPIQRIEG